MKSSRAKLQALLWCLLIPTIAGCGALGKVDYKRAFGRAGWQLPEEVIAALEIGPGDRVADLGAGDGWFVPYLAEAVGTGGRVYAVEVDPEKLAALRARAADEDWSNVLVVEGTAQDSRLPEGALDVVLLVNVYHHIEDRVVYFEGLRAALRPGGRVATIDMNEAGLGAWVTPGGHWTELETLQREMAAAGYEGVASFDFLPTQSFELFAPLPDGLDGENAP